MIAPPRPLLSALLSGLLSGALVGTLLIAGCGDSTPPANNHEHTPGDVHRHDEAGGNQDAPAPAAPGGDDHGAARSLGTVEVGGATLAVSRLGEIEAGQEAHFEIEHTGGPVPAAIRIWIGVESSEGSVKSLADGGDGHFHVHADAPAAITPEMRLWIEVENAAGERSVAWVGMS